MENTTLYYIYINGCDFVTLLSLSLSFFFLFYVQ